MNQNYFVLIIFVRLLFFIPQMSKLLLRSQKLPKINSIQNGNFYIKEKVVKLRSIDYESQFIETLALMSTDLHFLTLQIFTDLIKTYLFNYKVH